MFQCIIKQAKTKRKIFRQSWTKRLEKHLAEFIFATSETELDYYQQETNVRVASRPAEPLKT